MDSEDTGTDVSDVESTDSASAANLNEAFAPEPLANAPKDPKDSKHKYNKTGSMVIKHRTNSSLGANIDLVDRMVSRWGSMTGDELGLDGGDGGDVGTDSDYDDADPNKPKPQKHKRKDTLNAPPRNMGHGTHRRKKSAQDEIRSMAAEREALESSFDKYIDPEDNGDVDIEEWCMGLTKLDVQLSEAQQRKIYRFMDKDDSGFIEKNDFVMFATARVQDPELQSLQQPIIDAVRAQNLHDRSSSNLIGAGDAGMSQDWSDLAMEELQREMEQAMTGMVVEMKEKLTEEQQFQQEVDKRMDENPEALASENAMNWTKYEVAVWLSQMQMERYVRYFADEGVDGSMLLEDMNQNMLETNLAVRTIHAKKIMREIYNLKKAVRGVTDLILDESECVHHHHEDMELKIAHLALKEQLARAKMQKDKLKEFYENELIKLNDKIIALEEAASRKKHGRKASKMKHVKKDSRSMLPTPPNFDEKSDSLLSIGMGAVVSASPLPSVDSRTVLEEPVPDTDAKDSEPPQTESQNAEQQNSEETKAADTEDATQSQNTARESIVDAGNSSDSDVLGDDDMSESDSYSDDDGSSGRLLGMSQPQLMQVRRRKHGPSARQLNRFLRDLHKKKESNRDTFCIEDVDTIMSWTAEEVACWMMGTGFEQYAFACYALPIDGDMLLRDVDRESIVEDLGVLKVHSARILRQIEKLRSVIKEGFDEDVLEGVSLLPDPARPSLETIESLQEQIATLQKERDQVMQALEAKDGGDEEDGFFSNKIAELEAERDALKEGSEQMETDMNAMKEAHEANLENLSNTLNEANASCDALRKEVKQLKKDVRKAKRAAAGDDFDDEESEEEEDEDAKMETEDMEPVEITHDKAAVDAAIEKEMSRQERFGLEERVLEWSPAEVCAWLTGIQFGLYVPVFYSAQIFGDVLLQDIGTRMLTKFQVSSMHIPKLLRQVELLRQSARDKGVRITLSEELIRESQPKPAKAEKAKKAEKGKKGKGGKRVAELEKELAEERRLREEADKGHAEKTKEMQMELQEEKGMRIGMELELEEVRREFDNLQSSGSKLQVERLENLVSSVEESKIRTVRDLNEQLHSLRVGCRLMQKEIAYLKTKQGFHPIDSLVSSLGYASPPKY